MKKMKNRDLKKLALLGLASGTVLTTQAIASEQTGSIDPSQTLAFNSCNSRHGCGHSDDQAYRSTPSQNNGYYYTNQSCNGRAYANGTSQPQTGTSTGTPPSSGCNGATPSNGQAPTAYNQRGSYYYPQQWVASQTTQPQTSGSGMTTPQGQPNGSSSGSTGTSSSTTPSPTAYNQRGAYYYPQQWDASQTTQPQTSGSGMTTPQGQPNGSSSGSTGTPSSTNPSPTAYNQRGSYYYPQQWGTAQSAQPQSGCGGASQPRQVAAGCGGMSSSQRQMTAYNPRGSSSTSQQWDTAQPAQPQSGCGGSSQPKQTSSSCGGATPSKGQSTSGGSVVDSGYMQPWQSTRPAEPQTGCASRAAPQADTTGQGSSAYMQRYNRWESADTGKSSSTTAASMPAMTESDLLLQLNPQGKTAYQNLDAAGKALALKLANQSCKGQNECKGLNACKAADHKCAGLGSCAGTSTGPFKDKNLAVKVAAMKMAEKRAKASPSK